MNSSQQTISTEITQSAVEQFIQANYSLKKEDSAFSRVAPSTFKKQIHAYLVKKQQKDIISSLGELIEYSQLVSILGDDHRI